MFQQSAQQKRGFVLVCLEHVILLYAEQLERCFARRHQMPLQYHILDPMQVSQAAGD